MKKSILIAVGLVVAMLAFGGTARGDEAGGFTLSNCTGGGCRAAVSVSNATSAASGVTIDDQLTGLSQHLEVELGFTPSPGFADPVTLASDFFGAYGNSSSATSNPSSPSDPGGPGGTGPGTPGGMTVTSEPATGLLALLDLAFMGLSFVLRRSLA